MQFAHMYLIQKFPKGVGDIFFDLTHWPLSEQDFLKEKCFECKDLHLGRMTPGFASGGPLGTCGVFYCNFSRNTLAKVRARHRYP